MFYVQDPHQASREFLYGLQEDVIFLNVFRFLYPFNLSYTKRINTHLSEKVTDIPGLRKSISHQWNQGDETYMKQIKYVEPFNDLNLGRS